MKNPSGNNTFDLTNSLKEFQDIHNETQSRLNKGNFSFGTKFYDSGKDINKEYKNSDDEDDDFDYDFGNNQNSQKYSEMHNPIPKPVSNKERKQWGKKQDSEKKYSPEFKGPVDTYNNPDFPTNPSYAFQNDDEYNYPQREYPRQDPVENFHNYDNRNYQCQDDNYEDENYEDDNYEEDYEEDDNDYDQEDNEAQKYVQNEPQPEEETPKQNFVLDINFESTQELKKKEAKRQQFLKRREDQEKKRKLEMQKKKEVKSKDPNFSSQGPAKAPQSVKSKKSQKNIVNSGSNKYAKTKTKEIDYVQTKANNPEIISPIAELKRKVRKNNLMMKEGEESKSPSQNMSKLGLTPSSRKQR